VPQGFELYASDVERGEKQRAKDGGNAVAKKVRVGESVAGAEGMVAGEEVGGGSSRENGMAEIDEDLHSRQLAVYGRETMRRLSASNVLVSGLNGLGAEIGACPPHF
jgi:ubiquitin-activating enzyme E1